VSGSGPRRPPYDDLAALVMEQAARIAEQDVVIAALTAKVAELRRRLGMDSSNSSRPPSSDGLAAGVTTRPSR